MPLDSTDFPEEIQVAFFIYSFLPDKWEGMSGAYLGKEWGEVEYLFRLYEVENPKETLTFMKLYENAVVKFKAEKQKNERKAEERKQSAGSGKTYTHNVKG